MKRIYLIYCLLVGISFCVYGQNDVPDVTSTFALTNANVVVKPGTTLENTTVIIKDGYIQQVGSNLSIPFDAEIIEADSMFIYAGFIAGLSHIGLKKQEDNKDNDESVKAHNPPPAAAGITPDVSSSKLLDPSNATVAGFRKEGFALAHVVPKGRMMAGKGALILLKGSSPQEMVLQEDMSLYGSLLASKTRVYPSTTIGVMSKWREMYRQAELASQHETKFKSGSAGIKRPTFDSSIKSMYDVTSKSIPVFFHAPKTLDLSRAMALQKELGFKMVAANSKQAFKLKDKIKRNNLPLVISLDLPKKAKESKKKKDEEADESDEMMALKERAKQSKKEYESQAAVLEESGIPFSFSVTETKAGDVKKNILRMIEAGLSEEAALAALTTNPAKVLGIQQLAGTVERGRFANLIVTDTSYFKEKANIRFVFVEGKKYEMEVKEKKEKKEGDADAVIDLAGTWSLVLSADGTDIDGTIEIEKSGDTYTGSMITDMSEKTDFDSVEVDGSNVTIKLSANVGGGSAPVVVDIVVEDDEFEGSVNIANGMMTADVTGSKEPN